MYIHYHVWNRQLGICYPQEAQLSAREDLDKQDWEAEEVQEQGDARIRVADSLRCAAETNITR